MLQNKFAPIALSAAVLMLAGCGGSARDIAKVDGLEALGAVQVVSREEGSGTRSAFADLAGFADTGQGSDATADTALIVSDTDSVTEAVARDKSAIGYVSMGAKLSDKVKSLAVEGTEASVENVASGDYTLCRPFCLVWSGDLSDVELDFMTYVMGKGQALVKESYSPVHDETDFLSDMSAGTVTIHGSTSAAPLITELAREYESINPNAEIITSASDSTTGINDAMQGLCDLGMASRELKDYESELLNCKTVAYDGIAVIVNVENPLDNITMSELKSLFTGDAAYWEDINNGRE